MLSLVSFNRANPVSKSTTSTTHHNIDKQIVWSLGNWQRNDLCTDYRGSKRACPDLQPVELAVAASLTASRGVYRMRRCCAMERKMAPSSHRFRVGGITNKLWFSLRLDNNKITMATIIFYFTLEQPCR